MNKLLVLSFLGAIFGILLLFYLSGEIVPREVSINELSDLYLGKMVLVRGTVASVSNNRGNYFLSVCKAKCVSIPIFDKMVKKMAQTSVDVGKIASGNSISAVGVLQEGDFGYSLRLLDHNSLQVEGK